MENLRADFGAAKFNFNPKLFGVQLKFDEKLEAIYGFPAYVIDQINWIHAELVKIKPRLLWPQLIKPTSIDQEVLQVSMTAQDATISQVLFQLAQELQKLPRKQRYECLHRLAKQCKNAMSIDQIRLLLSVHYELIVFCWLQQIGASPSFVSSKNRSGPDIKIENPSGFVECKDMKSQFKWDSSEQLLLDWGKLCYAVQTHVDRAYKQLLNVSSYDDLMITFIDLPHGVFDYIDYRPEHISDKSGIQRSSRILELLGVQRKVDSSGTLHLLETRDVSGVFLTYCGFIGPDECDLPNSGAQRLLVPIANQARNNEYYAFRKRFHDLVCFAPL